MGLFKGWLYCFLWYTSILAGYVGLFCPLLPLLLISNKLYRYCTDVVFTYWQYYPTALLEILCGCDIQITGDVIRTNEMSILIMNHRTRTDWNFIWPTVYHCIVGTKRYQHSTKFILKDIIRHIPGPGWVMQLACFIYIKRCWQQDELIFMKFCNYIHDLSYKFSLLIFPEGTDLTIKTKQQSDQYAKQHQLELYENVLHPRTTGFVYLTKTLLDLQQLDAIYDLTIIYPDLVPQNEFVLLNGKFPKTIKIHLVRYHKEILPKNQQQLKEFLIKRWYDKEHILYEFKQTGQFLHGPIIKRNNNKQQYMNELIIALIFWTILPFIVLYLLISFKWYQYLIISNTIILLLLNLFGNGFQQFEIDFYNFKKKLWQFVLFKQS